MHWFVRMLIGVLAPLGLIVGGAALFGVGLDNDLRIVTWIGLGLFVAGLIWGGILLLFNSGGGSFFD